MKCEDTGRERFVRLLIVGMLVAWGLIAYVRGLLLADPAPALHGVGLAMVVLNAVMFALLGAGIVLGRQKGSPWRGPGIVLLLLSVAAGMAL